LCSLHWVSLSLKRFRCRKLDMDVLIAREIGVEIRLRVCGLVMCGLE
jgi:hypothetical protein